MNHDQTKPQSFLTMTTTAALIQAVAKADRYEAQDAIAALSHYHLEDDYRRDPDAACKKALRMTRAIRKPYRRLRAIDRLLGNHGVESARLRNGEHAFSYSNTGDSYAATVVLFASGTFRVSSWGDIVERGTNRYA